MSLCQSATTDSCPEQVQDSSSILVVEDESRNKYDFPCESSLEFWRSITPSNRDPGMSKHFAHIEEHFKSEFRDYVTKDIKTWNKIWKLIKRFLAVPENESVKVCNFIRLLKSFGSIKKISKNGVETCLLLDQIENLVDRGYVKQGKKSIWWFAGNMSEEEAERCLNEQKKGTFLIRFDENLINRGGFRYSVKAENEVLHIGILGDPSQSCGEGEYNARLKLQVEDEEETFPTLIELVHYLRSNPVKGVRAAYIYPDLPLNATFQGYER